MRLNKQLAGSSAVQAIGAALLLVGAVIIVCLLHITLPALPQFTSPAAVAQPPAESPAPVDAKVQVWFSPRGGCTEAIVAAIGAAREEVLLLGYGFTSEPIGQALRAAKRRGLTVELVLDPCNLDLDRSQADECDRAGIPVWIDHRHAILHSKAIVLDGKVTLTGSFNWSAAAENMNAENLVRLDSAKLAQRYRENWKLHKAHSRKFSPPTKEDSGLYPRLPCPAAWSWRVVLMSGG